MNKIVREHYPVSSLPEDLREGLSMDGEVRIVIEEAEPQTDARSPVFSGFEMTKRAPLKAHELREVIERFKAGRPSIDPDDAVSRIRELRNEWDDE